MPRPDARSPSDGGVRAPLRVTSSANPNVALLKSLHAKKGRAETGWFLAEGARLALEAADQDAWPVLVAIAESALDRAHIKTFADDAAAHGARVLITTEKVLGQVARRDNPQTVIAAYRQRWAGLEALAAGAFAVALYEPRDPGNLGTILRACDAAGASGVALIGQACDPFSVECVRATMGSIFTTPVARTTFEELDAWRRARGFTMLAASLRATQRHDQAPLGERTLILMGNEQAGLPEEVEEACDALVRIPMRGRADSLNLAMAATLMVYEVWRRRGYDGA
ncbi:MAG: RNA methyltransferase [Hydrogenophilaceae bacterium]|jgi:TrmH family RNA methyltransferase|nr:RNA methyltransferase [Hydrogenophilaceae bacterium]